MRRRAVALAGVCAALAACGPPEVVRPGRTLAGPIIDLYLDLDAAVRAPAGAPELVRRDFVEVGPQRHREAILCHPPGLMRFRIEVGGSARFITTFHRPRALVEQGSDGVELVVRVAEAADAGAEVFRRFLAASDPDDVDVRVDLSAFAGRTIDLIVGTDPGPAGDPRYDSAWLVAPRIRQQVDAVRGGAARVVLVTIDTLRADRLSGYGNPVVLTPALDRLSRGGRTWARAYAQSNATTPSHAVILTGRTPGETGVYGSDTPLESSFETLPEVLHGRGYGTAAVVSVAHLKPEMSGLGQGFETFVPTRTTRGAAATTDLALALSIRESSRPLFLWAHYFDPHTDYQPPAHWRRYYEPRVTADGAPLPERLAAEKDAVFPASVRMWLASVRDPAVPAAWYAGEVSHASHEIGRLLAGLEGWSDGPLTVVLTADHGESLGEHGIYYGHTGLFAAQIGVPLIVRRPGTLPAVVATPGAHVDIYPMILGEDSGPLTRDDAPPGRTLVAFHAHVESLAVTRGARKVIVPVEPYYACNRPVHRFDLDIDPEESTDLPRDPIFDELEGVARAEAARRHAAQSIPITAEELDRLHELGYLH